MSSTTLVKQTEQYSIECYENIPKSVLRKRFIMEFLSKLPEELERIQKRLDEIERFEFLSERYKMFFSKLSHLVGIDVNQFYQILNSENDFDIMVRNDMARPEIQMREIK